MAREEYWFDRTPLCTVALGGLAAFTKRCTRRCIGRSGTRRILQVWRLTDSACFRELRSNKPLGALTQIPGGPLHP